MTMMHCKWYQTKASHVGGDGDVGFWSGVAVTCVAVSQKFEIEKNLSLEFLSLLLVEPSICIFPFFVLFPTSSINLCLRAT